MKRRLFLKSSILVAAAPALAQASLPQGSAAAHGRVFYDARFENARLFAERLFPAASLTPVNGDLSAGWVRNLATPPTKALSFSGVTAESFYFCLKTLLQQQGAAHASIERVTRDLHAWEIGTAPYKDGTA